MTSSNCTISSWQYSSSLSSPVSQDLRSLSSLSLSSAGLLARHEICLSTLTSTSSAHRRCDHQRGSIKHYINGIVFNHYRSLQLCIIRVYNAFFSIVININLLSIKIFIVIFMSMVKWSNLCCSCSDQHCYDYCSHYNYTNKLVTLLLRPHVEKSP